MRWVKIDDKGLWHYSKYSIDSGSEHGSTVCDRTGVLYAYQDRDRGRVCSACNQFVNGS